MTEQQQEYTIEDARQAIEAEKIKRSQECQTEYDEFVQHLIKKHNCEMNFVRMEVISPNGQSVRVQVQWVAV